MKTKLCFVADICIRISTYSDPEISEKELKDFISFADFIAENANKLDDSHLYFLEEELINAMDAISVDPKLSANFEGLENAIYNLEYELNTEILEREENA